MAVLREILNKAIENKKIPECHLSPLIIISVSEDIQRLYSGIQDPRKSIDLDELHHMFLKAIQSNVWDGIELIHWKKACWILWYKNLSGDDHLASSPAFLDKYLNFCEKNVSSRLVKNLIFIYLMDYEEDLPGGREVASFIRNSLSNDRFSSSLHVWKRRDDLYGIFSSKNTFSPNAKTYISSMNTARDFLANFGLEDQLEYSNYAQNLFVAVICEVENLIPSTSAGHELFKKLKDLAVCEDNIRYPNKKYILIESLLKPWRSRSPNAELKKELLNFFLKYFYDLRTEKGRSNWVGVSEESKRIVRKWLAGETLEQFFEIIDYTAKDEHWRYRREFWKAYFNAGYIDDACMAVGKDSRSAAKSQLIRGNELITSDIRGVGVMSDHSALIFKVGDLTICEWSHAGKCRVWFENNKNSPELYKEFYDAEELRSKSEKIVKEYSSDGISHQGSAKYLWQNKLSDFIEYHTGIKIPSHKYMSINHD